MAKQSNPAIKRPSAAKTLAASSLSASPSAHGRAVARPRIVIVKNSGAPTARIKAVLSKPSKASAVGQLAQRAFVAGVESQLREAKLRGIRVTVQDGSGHLVRGVPSRRGGEFVVLGKGTVIERKLSSTLLKDAGPAGSAKK